MSGYLRDVLDQLSRKPLQESRIQEASSNPTTGFLTATTFIYALGAGITAAAGTRLALQ